MGKICVVCNIEKDYNCFEKNRLKCIGCRKEYKKQYQKIYKQEYMLKHKLKFLAYWKEYRKKHKKHRNQIRLEYERMKRATDPVLHYAQG